MHEQVYLGDIATGDYTNGDEKTSIVLGELAQSKGKLCREMTVSAPTWGRIERAIANIRSGDIRSVNAEQTVLEQLQAKLADSEERHTTKQQHIADLYAELNLAHHESGTYKRFAYGAADYLNEQCATLDCDTRDQRGLRELHDAILNARTRNEELARIKVTRWYSMKTWLNNVLVGSGAKQPGPPV